MTDQMDLKSQHAHAMLPEPDADEFSRQEYVKSLKYHLASEISSGNQAAFTGRAAARFEKKEGRAAATMHDVRIAMKDDP